MDDDPEASDTKKILESFGYSVPYVTSTVKDAIDKTCDLLPDIILMNLCLEDEFRGIHAEATEVKKELEKLRIPLLYLTTDSEDVKTSKDLLTSSYGCLIKPYDVAELKYAIELVIYKDKIKKEYEKSKNYYKTIFEHTGTATVIIEEDTIISLANTEFEKLSGYPREEIEGKRSWTEFVEKNDLIKMREYHSLRRINADSAPLIYDFQFINREGTVKNIHLDIGMIPGTKKSVASLLDVTERINAFEEIRKLYETERKARADANNAKEEISMVLERISDSFVALDNNWHYTYVNEKAAEHFGKTTEEMVGNHIWTLFPEGIDQPFYKAYHKAMEEQVFIHLEEYYAPYDRWFENDIYPSKDGITIFFKDITERVKMREELLFKTALLEAQLESTIDGILVVDDNGRSILYNQRFGEMWNIPPEILDSKDDKKMIECVLNQLRYPEIFIQKIEYLYANKSENSLDEIEFNDGKVFERYSSPLIDSNGDYGGRIWYFRDITELKKSQEAVRRSENKYRGLFDHAADGIFLMKGDTFIDCNKKTLEIYGVTRDQIINKTPYAFSPELQANGESSREKAFEHINKALAGYPQHFEWIHRRLDGTPFYAEVSLNRVKIEDEYLIQAIVRDVTDRKKSEEIEKENIKLKELDQLKSMFIASMSHELRTPLNSIIGFTGIILQGMTGEITDEQRKQLNIVKNSAQHLLALINDVIDLSKIEADKVELIIEDFDLSSVIMEIEQSFMDAVERKGLKMSVKMPESLPMNGDERRTKQVIMNMVSNAVKFTDKGKLTISIEKNDEFIEISVKDTGMGIKEEDQSKLFQAFSRIQSEDQPLVEGTGLGLYLSKKIAKLLNGDIKVKSQFNVGSEFIFILPVIYTKPEVIP